MAQPQNQYLPIANGTGANALTAAQWAALGNLLGQGFQSGVVPSIQFNTFLRQLSVPVAGIAQFMADNQTQDVLDDGSVANFEAKFKAAILSAVEIEGVVFASDGGSADALIATPTPALTSYKIGQVVAVLKNASVSANATTTPTISLNGLGAVTIVKGSGMPLYAGDLPQGGLFVCVFDGTYFRHVGVTLSTGDLRAQSGQAVAVAVTGVNSYGGTLTPAPVNLTPRMEVLAFFGAANTSAAAPTLLLNNLGSSLPIVKQGGGTPSAGDLLGIIPLVLNTAGTAWIINGLVNSDVLALIATNAGVICVVDAAGASAAQTLVGSASPAVSAYGQSQVFIVTARQANTAPDPTLNVTGANGASLGALRIVKRDGSRLVAGDIPAGATILGVVTGGGTTFALLGILPSDIVPIASTIVQLGQTTFGNATGQDTYALTLSPAPPAGALPTGMRVLVYFGNANQTTNPTLNINQAGQYQIFHQNGTAVAPGDVVGFVALICNQGRWFISSITQSEILALIAAAAPAAVANSPYAGTRGIAPILSSQTWVVPAGVYYLKRVRLWGAGGGGGGSNGSNSAASAGAGGGYAEKFNIAVTPGQQIPVTIGAGGTQGNSNPTYGGTGGTTSFGYVFSATGGGGGYSATNGIQGGGAGLGGQGQSGDFNQTGINGSYAYVSSAPGSGIGGSAPFGGASPTPNFATAGNNGNFPGGGANGGSGTNAGGLGAPGFCIVEF